MKMLNPSDAELNAAFAEKVAGWLYLHAEAWQLPGKAGVHHEIVAWVNNRTAQFEKLPDFVRSADAVLPYLENHYVEFGKRYKNTEPVGWVIRVSGTTFGQAEEDTFPKAAVLALLRAHGVEVEFTK